MNKSHFFWPENMKALHMTFQRQYLSCNYLCLYNICLYNIISNGHLYYKANPSLQLYSQKVSNEGVAVAKLANTTVSRQAP